MSYPISAYISVLLLVFHGKIGALGAITLLPSTLSVCPGHTVTLTCSVSTNSMIWEVSVPGHSPQDSSLTATQSGQPSPIDVDGNVFAIERTSSDPFEATLTFTANSTLNGTMMSCVTVVNNMEEKETVTLFITSQPNPPMGFTKSEMFQSDYVIVDLQWNSPSFEGNISYSVSAQPPTLSSQMIGSAGVELRVAYNVLHTVTVTATNCAGSASAAIDILYSNCGYPPVSENVMISGYSSPARNGSVISFNCRNGVLSEQVPSARCDDNGRWNPDPTSLQCIADCGVPPSTMNVNVSYTSTLENSTITFQCEEGLKPNTTFAGICQANGTWSKDPAEHMCTGLDGAAGVPSSPAVPIAITVVLIIILVVSVASVTIVVVVKVKRRGFKDADNSQVSLELQDTNESPTEYCTTKHPGPRGNQSVTVNTNTLVYAGLDLPSEKKLLAPHADHADNPTSYADINFAATNNRKKVPYEESADKLLNLDSLLIQLKPEVTSKWNLFARVVGLSQEVIKDLSNCGADERMVEMLDYWLRNHPSKPTWREVAQILEELHLYQLADDLLKVYETGELPVPFDMNEVPEGTLPRNEPPPPLPPKLPDLDDGPESQPLVGDLPPKPPPHGGLPVHAPPPLPPPYHENGGSMLPPRPPKSHSHGMPRRPPKPDTVFTAVPALPPKPKT